MLAKVVAWGPDRRRRCAARRPPSPSTAVLGVTTNIAFLRDLLGDPDVRAGRLDTGLVERGRASAGPGAGRPDASWPRRAGAPLAREPRTRVGDRSLGNPRRLAGRAGGPGRRCGSRGHGTVPRSGPRAGLGVRRGRGRGRRAGAGARVPAGTDLLGEHGDRGLRYDGSPAPADDRPGWPRRAAWALTEGSAVVTRGGAGGRRRRRRPLPHAGHVIAVHVGTASRSGQGSRCSWSRR